MKKFIFVFLFTLSVISVAFAQNYQPTWESLDSRPTPAWFDEAKFGIKICWGLFSVPAWAPTSDVKNVTNKNYAEWYWYNISDRMGHHRRFHANIYGGEFKYQDFAPMFKGELWNPKEWAGLCKRSGAKYVILITKHHDGYCLWPNTESWNWNSVDIGPKRDVVGELTEAVKAEGMKMGFYYSLYEWFNPIYKNDVDRYVKEHMVPQMKDLIVRYKPDMFYGDGEWDYPSETWKSKEFLTWLFNESPVKDFVAVNDRWGNETRSHHGGFYLSEYFKYTGDNAKLGPQHPWCETRSIGASFGYNRNEKLEDYQTAKELIHLLVNCVARGGGLMLNIGPSADGGIPVIMQERVTEIGDWLKVNGEAIYGSKAWKTNTEGDSVCYTTNNGAVYAICLKWPGKELSLKIPDPISGTAITMLGYDKKLEWSKDNGILKIKTPDINPDEMPCRYAYVFKISAVN